MSQLETFLTRTIHIQTHLIDLNQVEFRESQIIFYSQYRKGFSFYYSFIKNIFYEVSYCKCGVILKFKAMVGP